MLKKYSRAVISVPNIGNHQYEVIRHPTRMSISYLVQRLSVAKQSFVTRRFERIQATGLVTDAKPHAGDLCLAKVERLGHHRRLELVTGRRAQLYEGDEIIVAYGARYATDQFHSVIPDGLGPCDLVAAGGIASRMVSRHANARHPTRIEPIGLIADQKGAPLNLRNFGFSGSLGHEEHRSHRIAVVGSSMNSGKTTLVCELARLVSRSGLTASCIKLTGTGSGGDLWKYHDSGASCVFDFTDGGYATTVDVPVAELEQMLTRIESEITPHSDVVILEIADGLYQKETAGLLRSPSFRSRIDSVLFAASDPMSGVAGVQELRANGLEPSAISGSATASDLAGSELALISGVEVFPISRFYSDPLSLNICMRSAHRFGEAPFARSA